MASCQRALVPLCKQTRKTLRAEYLTGKRTANMKSGDLSLYYTFQEDTGAGNVVRETGGKQQATLTNSSLSSPPVT